VREQTGGRDPSAMIDASDNSLEEMAQWLSGLGLNESTVRVVWPQESAGLLMPYALFLECFDELWFPSADDVVVITEAGDRLLEISHEEVFQLFKL
jgi:hypothetical protein